MKFLFRILRRLVGYLLGVLLVALIAAAATFGWQGYKLYQSAVQAIDRLEEALGWLVDAPAEGAQEPLAAFPPQPAGVLTAQHA